MPSPFKKQRVDGAGGPGAGEESEEDAGDESSYDEDAGGASGGDSGEGDEDDDEDQRADSDQDYGDDLEEDAEDAGDEDDVDKVRGRLTVRAVGPREEGCRNCWLCAATAHLLAPDVRGTCTRANASILVVDPRPTTPTC